MNEKFLLPVFSPFRLDYTIWALRRRKNNSVDRWDGCQYSRIIVSKNDPVKIFITQENPSNNPEVSIFLKGKRASSDQTIGDIRLLVQKMLGLDLDLQPFYALLDTDEVIRALVHQFAGVKPPRFPSLFEAMVNAIACQQVTLDVGILMLNRLAEKFGIGFDDDGTLLHAFPRPEDLANASEEEIKKSGFSYQKARAIKELAVDISTNKIKQADLEEMTNQEAIEYLSKLRGLGRWSAEYILLRGLGRINTFPGDDVGAQNNLQRLFHLDQKPGYEEIKKLTSRWHPYEGLVYFHLLLNKLNMNGVMGAIVLGETQNPNLTLAVVVGLGGLAILFIANILATQYSMSNPRKVKNWIEAPLNWLRRLIFHHQVSMQEYSSSEVSPYFRVNGRPPKDADYDALAKDNFAGYVLEVGGLVEKPFHLTLADLRNMSKTTQITKHNCIQGWSAVGQWGGVQFGHQIELCYPRPEVRYVVFYAFDNKSTSEPHPSGLGYYYGTIDMELAGHRLTILAYEFNGQPLPVPHGAPLRLRVETQLGFKMVKYIRVIEFVAEYHSIGEGQGGWREDHQNYSTEAGI